MALRTETCDSYVGDVALNKRGVLTTKYLSEHGWRKSGTTLATRSSGLPPEERHVLLTKAP